MTLAKMLPIADVANTGWTLSTGIVLWTLIHDTTFNHDVDATYISATGVATCTVQISMETRIPDTGVASCTVGVDARVTTGGATAVLTLALVRGAVTVDIGTITVTGTTYQAYTVFFEASPFGNKMPNKVGLQLLDAITLDDWRLQIRVESVSAGAVRVTRAWNEILVPGYNGPVELFDPSHPTDVLLQAWVNQIDEAARPTDTIVGAELKTVTDSARPTDTPSIAIIYRDIETTGGLPLDHYSGAVPRQE